MPAAKTVLQSVATNFLLGYYFIQLSKQIVADSGAVMWSEPHNLSVAPATWIPKQDADGKFIDMVAIPAMDLNAVLDAGDAHLVEMGYPAISAEDRATIVAGDTVRPTFPLPPKPPIPKP